MGAQPEPTPPRLPDKARAARTTLAARESPDYLPARMVNEYAYCPRLFYYEWVDGLFAHNADTIEGAHRHGTVDDKADALPPPGSDDEAPVTARSVTLSDEALRVIAKLDLVEAEGVTATPVDYKKGAPRAGDDGPEAWPADRIQVGVQALVLRANGYTTHEAVLYYAKTKQRVRVPVDDALVAETQEAIVAARDTAERGVIPPPLVDSPKCPRCSLVGICLPDETTVTRDRHVVDETEQVQPWLIEPAVGDDSPPHDVRRLVPSRDDLRPLYVAGQGMSIGRSGDVLRVKDRDRKVVQEARLFQTSQVNLFGNVSITAPAIQALCGLEIPIAYFSGGGWFYGITQGLGARNAYLRAEQFRLAAEPAFCLRVASTLVGSKIRNQRTLLNRNHVEPPKAALSRLKTLSEQSARATALDELLGIEGTAARIYFEHFAGMIKVDDGFATFAFEHRNRRPPRDPVNALLSLAYSLLSKDLTVVATMVGFDPFWGFYHQPRYGRPALALDLMEVFRPLVADSAVITAINTGMVTADDFVRVGDTVSMQPGARKGLLRAYEQRIDTLVTHPIFDYRVSYRRVFEIQTRLLARLVAGEITDWPVFETR